MFEFERETGDIWVITVAMLSTRILELRECDSCEINFKDIIRKMCAKEEPSRMESNCYLTSE
jgi:hypothetical protein